MMIWRYGLQLSALLAGLWLLSLPALANVLDDAQREHQAEVGIQQALAQTDVKQEADTQRIPSIRPFIRAFKRLNADGWEDAVREDNAAKMKAEQLAFMQDVEALLMEYEQHIKPLLLNNLRFHRADEMAKLHQGELQDLFFTKRHKQQGVPFSGLLAYEDGGQAAGLVVLRPDIQNMPSITQALIMESELHYLLRAHIDDQKVSASQQRKAAYNQQSLKLVLPKKEVLAAHPGLVSVGTVAVYQDEQKQAMQQRLALEIGEVKASDLSASVRMDRVDHFVATCQHLDDQGLGNVKIPAWDEAMSQQKIAIFLADLQALIGEYAQIKPILMANIQHPSDDVAADVNYGALLSLFRSHRRNYFTAKPVSGLLRHQQDVSESWFGHEYADAGVLVNFPELEHHEVVQQAIMLEAELVVLLDMQKQVLDKED